MRFATTQTTNPLHAFSTYRFHFNGQEADNEVAGSGNSYTAEFWQYDSRLGRRWNVDPMTARYAGLSPYATFNNCPIVFIDPLGLEGEEPKPGEGTAQNPGFKSGKGTNDNPYEMPEVEVNIPKPDNTPQPSPTLPPMNEKPLVFPNDNTTTNYPKIVIGAGGEFKLPHVPDMVGIIVEAYDNAQAFRNAALNTNQYKQLGKGHVSNILTTYSLLENVYNKEYLNAAVDGISLAVSTTRYNPYYSVGMTILQITNSDIVKSRIARDNYIIHRQYVQLSIRLEKLGDRKGAEFYSEKATEIERKMQDDWYNSIKKTTRK